ncbi:hypothetical protein AHF37_09063, partial [Paragonimus kellicotti]
LQIFFDQYGSGNTENKVYYEVITYIVFVAFVTIMTIIMMNLLVGLAVDDIKEVRRKAAIIREEMKVAKKEEEGEGDTETRKKPEEVLQDLHQLTLHIGKLLNRLVDRVNESGLAESRVNRPPVEGTLRAGVAPPRGAQPGSLMATTMLGDSRMPSRIERLHIDDDVDEEPFEFS